MLESCIQFSHLFSVFGPGSLSYLTIDGYSSENPVAVFVRNFGKSSGYLSENPIGYLDHKLTVIGYSSENPVGYFVHRFGSPVGQIVRIGYLCQDLWFVQILNNNYFHLKSHSLVVPASVGGIQYRIHIH